MFNPVLSPSKEKAIQLGRSERGPVARCIRRATGTQDVEGPSEAIDPLQTREQRVPRLAAFFNILLGLPGEDARVGGLPVVDELIPQDLQVPKMLQQLVRAKQILLAEAGTVLAVLQRVGLDDRHAA